MKKHSDSYKKPLSGFDDFRVDLPNSFKIIRCPNCGTETPSSNLNLENKIGKCSNCNGVFSIENELGKLQTYSQKVKQQILRPEGIELFEFQNQLEVCFEQSITWIEWVLYIIALLFGMAGIGASIETGSILPFFILTILPLVISTIYYFRRKAKHRIFLLIDEEYLNISWRPRKFNRDQRFAISDIHQLFVKHKADLGVWQLYMISDQGNGQKQTKLFSLNSASKAKYIEQEIEAYLNIQDVVVPEES